MIALALLLLGTCEYKLGHTYITIAPIGTESAAVQLTTQPGCPWSLKEEFPWIKITSPKSGSGPARITYSVSPNPGRTSKTAYLDGFPGSQPAAEPAFRLMVIVFGRE